MKKVYASQDRLMLGHLKNVLVNEGLECITKNEHLTGVMGEIPLNECWLEIWVTEDANYDRAKEIIDRALTSGPSTGPEWECSGCGEKHDSQFTECWNCGRSCS